MLRPKTKQVNGTSETNHNKEGEIRFPSFIFKNLPPLLKEFCGCFDKAIEKDIALLGGLGVLSGCLPKIYGKYDRKKYGANLFFFIVAPASAGKGSLTWTKLLGQKIHEQKRIEYREALEEYEISVQEARAKKNKGQLSNEPLVPPSQKMLFIPANTSASAFLQALSDNGGSGILFCSEADTLSNSLSQDWGNYSDIIRCAFHHETINSLRAANRQYLEIEKPTVSIILSGTPNQVTKLIPDSENGLFSRFAYYSFDIEPQMKNVWEESETDLEESLSELGEKVFGLNLMLNEASEPLQFTFSKEQQADFHKRYSESHEEFHFDLGLESISAIRRLGLIEFRIAMVLSCIRLVDATSLPDKIICNEDDYENAVLITRTLKEHAKKMFSKLPKSQKRGALSIERQKIFQSLPKEISRGEAVTIGEKLGFSSPTVDRLLSDTDFFTKTKRGVYAKVKR